MASVTSLDKDLRKLRLEKYTPAAAHEARAWIEEMLGERLPSSDLLQGLKDGVALCKLVNLAVPPPSVRYKQSAMPFVQMENIAHFLRACQAPPLNLQQHDTFLTVDLFEQKDPAQVLQCIGAFSRAANAANPTNFPTSIGPKTRSGALTPQGTGSGTQTAAFLARGASIASNSSSAYGGGLSHLSSDSVSGRRSPTKSPGSPGTVSSWSRRELEGSTAPAWNIAQYGYMGGASQGNLGIAFGSRRQITGAGPLVPSLTEKERIRREKIAEEERLRQVAEERRRAELQAEERARLEEERRWEEETGQLREEERRKVQEEKRQWEAQERQWKLTEEKRRKEEEEEAARVEEERRRARNRSPAKLRGQSLIQYQAEQADVDVDVDEAETEQMTHRNRIKELERELEQARQREADYERERQGRTAGPAVSEPPAKLRARSRSRPGEPPRSPRPNTNSQQLNRQESWTQGEREILQTKWKQHQADLYEDEAETMASPPLPKSPRPLPDPKALPQVKTNNTGSRPLPDPAKYASPPRAAAPQNRTDRFLASNPAPMHAAAAQQTYARELGATEERDAEDRRRIESQEKTKAGGWATKSLLEREMEMERQRQKEWEDAQKETATARRSDSGVDGIGIGIGGGGGGGIGGRWDVSQWSGFAGGDSQNKGSQGIGAGRRQIVGPRPLPNPGR